MFSSNLLRLAVAVLALLSALNPATDAVDREDAVQLQDSDDEWHEEY
eukprot:CAMPEP_0173169688 /NCGR_PEP_ID=MMETSP1141-20130122/843_1 /TAXON_ID=483371 /ORGANISM="non described non described, Strain CCMP2298" /LENGTH=46 /DNA_ID= /DNA_START= /DNA_END= /DNA_ORIENTATION=